jgi:hypothetical protein
MYGPRYDWFIREKDASGHPLLVEAWEPIPLPTQTADSVIYRFQWNQSIPIADVASFGTPSREILTSFLRGVEQEVDTIWSAWDPVSGTLVRTASNQYSGCRWKDSSNFDANNRLVFQEECLGTIDAYIYRAWFESPTDSLPARSSLHDPSLGAAWMDTIYASPNPNRPDTLYETDPVVLSRDGFGRVIAVHPVSKQGDSATYAYDAQGRLVLWCQFQAASTGWDTTAYLYSWNDAAGLLPPGVRMSGARIVGRDLELDLPAPDRVRADLLGLDGKLLSTIADRILPEGRTLVPISTRTGELVRIRSSNGESILRIPPRFQ